jgi:hypothetical protein
MPRPTLVARNPVVVFIGPPHHGKTTARKIFCELTPLSGASTSDVIYSVMSRLLGCSYEELRAQPKEELRPRLIELGDWLCGVDNGLPSFSLDDEKRATLDSLHRSESALCRVAFLSGCHALDGIRRVNELEHFKHHVGWLGLPVIVVWVHRPGHPTVQDNTSLTEAHADYVIVNDGSVDDLKKKIESLVSSLTAPASCVRPEGS